MYKWNAGEARRDSLPVRHKHGHAPTPRQLIMAFYHPGSPLKARGQPQSPELELVDGMDRP